MTYYWKVKGLFEKVYDKNFISVKSLLMNFSWEKWFFEKMRGWKMKKKIVIFIKYVVVNIFVKKLFLKFWTNKFETCDWKVGKVMILFWNVWLGRTLMTWKVYTILVKFDWHKHWKKEVIISEFCRFAYLSRLTCFIGLNVATINKYMNGRNMSFQLVSSLLANFRD